jgi:hypothetical protein
MWKESRRGRERERGGWAGQQAGKFKVRLGLGRREAWSSGKGRRLTSKRSWVRILPYTGWM